MFDSEDFVTYGGRAVHRKVIHDKIASLGWAPEQTAQLTDEQVKQVIDGRLGPTQINVAQTVPGSNVVLMQEDDDGDNSIMAPEPPGGHQPASGITMEGQQPTPPAAPVRRLTGVVAPGQKPTAAAAPANAEPILGEPPAPEPAPEPVAPPPPPAKPEVAKPPAPATDLDQFKALLDAVVALCATDATYAQASALATSHGLWDALKAYNAEAYNNLGGDSQDRPANSPDLCVGGMILKVESANGAVHILTTDGTLTLTGSGLNLRKQ